MTKNTLYTGEIFKEYLLNIEFLNSSRGAEVLTEHQLYGWLAVCLEDESLAKFPYAKSEFKRQWHLNQTYLNLLSNLSVKFKAKSIMPVLLKGISFFDRLYPEIGSRSMSDIDLLIKKEEVGETINILIEEGFTLKSDKKWRANSHKVEMSRIQDDIELVIELHTSLIYHCHERSLQKKSFTLEPYQVLADEELVFYLATHLGFQHTFLKLFWFIDIHLILSKTNIDENKVVELSKAHQVNNSLRYTLYILRTFFETPMGEAFQQEIKRIPNWRRKLLGISFLLNPKGNYLKYLLVKHLCRDSWKETLKYVMGWVKDRFF